MASSSFNHFFPATYQTKHDVFLSFRGEDTRDNFTSHFYAALCRKKMGTFIDNDVRRGDEISPALLKAIEQSKVSVIIFSKDYASSKWCLDELVKILDCKKTKGQIVIPVFYHVDPSDIRKQIGSFAAAFAKHEEIFKDKMGKVQIWRSALTEAANLSGWDSSVTRPESMLVDKIVGDILKKLNLTSSSISKGWVGINSRIEKVMSLLSIGLPCFRMVGIWGMGGIGKTTIAEAIFNQISFHFESSCFLNNVREAQNRGDLVRLRDDMFSKILEEENLHIGTANIIPAFIKDRILRKRVLIVLDDVNDSSQLETLFGGLDQFGPGSRAIITSRDKQVLCSNNITEIYDVEKFNFNDGLQLFCQHAFKQNWPPESYREFSERVVNYAQGIPLALEVLGSSLCRKSKQHWESTLKKLKKVPNLKILNVLKISYDGLDDEEKEIFLDIACFHKEKSRGGVTEILDSLYHSAISGIDVLIDKSLIKVQGNRIEMHDLLQKMGWNIVSEESKVEPGKRSRLWIPEDIHHVLTKYTGTETVKGIMLDVSGIKEMNLSPEAFAKMHNLKFLKINQMNKVLFPHGLESLPDELRYLSWPGYPLESLPLCLENLVELYMPCSNVKQLWNGTLNLVNLKRIDLHLSKNLIEIPDLSQATNLEIMDLALCESLVEIPASSIQHLNKLFKMNLRFCTKLRSLPSNINLSSLTCLWLNGCINLEKFPVISRNIESLELMETSIKEVPSLVEHVANVPEILETIEDLEDSLGNLKQVTDLKANGTPLQSQPSSITYMTNLKSLCISGCKGRDPIALLLPPSLSCFLHLEDLELVYLHILEIPHDVGCLSSLSYLDLRGNDFESIPASINQLSSLKVLDLSYCNRLQSLPELPETLQSLHANNCTSLETISSKNQFLWFIGNSSNIEFSWEGFIFINCIKLDKDTRIKIMEEAQICFQNLVEQLYHWVQRIYFFPGNALPEWFNYQSMSSSITIKLPPHGSNSGKLFGCALGIVVSSDHEDYNDGRDCFSVRWELQLFNDLKYKVIIGDTSEYIGCHFVESEHVVLFYQKFGKSFFDTRTETSFYLCLKILKRPWKVNSCGVRLLYDTRYSYDHFGTEEYATEDNYCYNEDEPNCTSSFVEEEEEPDAKRLKRTIAAVKASGHTQNSTLLQGSCGSIWFSSG